MNKSLKTVAGMVILIMLLLNLFASYPTVASTSNKIYFLGSQISSNTYYEGMNVYAGRNTSVILEHFFVGGNLSFSAIDVNDHAFDRLVRLIITMRNGTQNEEYWPHPLWPVPPGIYLTLVFTGYPLSMVDDALDDANVIKDMVEAELGITGLTIFGFDHNNLRTIIIIGIGQSSLELSGYLFADFIEFWNEKRLTSGLGELVSVENILEAPIAIAAIGIQKDGFSDNFVPVVGTTYIKPDAIKTPTNNSYEISINNITNHSGNITSYEFANGSVIKIRIPYVGNVTAYSPAPDNLFPDMTGEFDYLLAPEGPVNNSNVEDIWIKYNFNYSNETKFPVLKAQYSIFPVNPIFDLNITREIGFMLNVTNVGDETAYNITTAIPVRPQDVEEKTIFEINATRLFMMNLFNTLNQSQYWEIFEEMANLTIIAAGGNPSNNPDLVENLTKYYFVFYVHKTIKNFCIELANEHVDEMLSINTSASYQNMYYDPEYLDAEEYGLAAVVGEWDKLEPGENVTFSFKIVIPGVQNITNPVAIAAANMTYPDKLYLNYTDPGTGLPAYLVYQVPEELKNGTRDGIIAGLNSLRDRVSSNITQKLAGKYLNFSIGPLVQYIDLIGHQLYVAANGIVTQLNEPEPVIIGSVEVEDYSLLIDQNVTATVTVRNVGNADAENVEIILYHGITNYGFQIENKERIGNATVNLISARTEMVFNFTRVTRTNIGLHPVFAQIRYTDDNGEELIVYSNVIFVIIFPKFAQKPKPDYPFPTPELKINRNVDSENATVGQLITVNITITNIGDEATNIIIIDTFNTNSFVPIAESIAVYRDGVDITEQIMFHIILNKYVDGTRLIKIALLQNYTDGEVIGIYLEPNQTLTITYQVRGTSEGELAMFPLTIIYTTLHPVFTENPVEVANNESSGLFSMASHNPFEKAQDRNERTSITSYSNSFILILKQAIRRVPRVLLLITAGFVIMILASIIIYQRRRKLIQAQFSI